MPSLMEAVGVCRARGDLPPGGTVSVKDLMQRFQPDPPCSMRALLLKMLAIQPTTRWGIVIVTQIGIPRLTLPLSWFDKLFNDGDGVGPYFRHMSGHRQVFSWRVFGPFEMYTPAKKAELVAAGASAESAYLRSKAAEKGVPVDKFDRFMWVIDQPGDGGTVGGGDLFIAAQDVTQQLTSHEIAHAFGVNFEGDIYVNGVVQTYGDFYCPMDRGPAARSFQNHRLDYTKDGNNHQTSGPVMCAAHLFVLGWLDYQNNVTERTSVASQDDIIIDANQGAPAVGQHRRMALTIGRIPQNRDPSQFWVEYRAPVGFDRWIDRPVSTNNIDMPQGALVVHEMRSNRHVILVSWTPAVPGNNLRIPGTDRSVEIRHVDNALRNVTLRIHEV